MPRVEEFRLHSFGWENDPEEERFKLTTFDYLTTTTYTSTALFFPVEDSQKTEAAEILKEGLQRTLSQVRQFVGTIERDEDGHHSIVRKRNSTFQFVVQYLDSPEDNFPSFAEIAEAHFVASILGDINVLSNAPMTVGNKPEAHPDNHPPTASFKVNIIRGGIIFNLHNHHYANGLTGWVSFAKQLAGNCYAIKNKTEFPSYNMKWVDQGVLDSLGLSRPISKKPEIYVPPRPPNRNMQHRQSQSLMFHLRKSKAAELKKAASPSDGSWITTYNAICALMWRVLSRIREPLYNLGPDFKPLWAEGVNMPRLFTNPPLPEHMQGNLQFDIKSTTASLPQLTLAEIISEAPLSKLASYTRQMTDSVTIDMLAASLEKVAHVRNKQDLSIYVDSFPPMAILVSDWRYCEACTYDFGFAEPSCWRLLFGGVPLCQACVYPPRKGPAGDDEGVEVQVTFETEVVQQLLDDPEWNKYFEFRGVDAWEEVGGRPKL